MLLNRAVDFNNEKMDGEIRLSVQWPDEGTGFVYFSGVLWACLDYYGGVSGPENIMSAFNTDECGLLREKHSLLPALYNNKKLNYFEIGAIQSSSTIKVIAERVLFD